MADDFPVRRSRFLNRHRKQTNANAPPGGMAFAPNTDFPSYEQITRPMQANSRNKNEEDAVAMQCRASTFLPAPARSCIGISALPQRRRVRINRQQAGFSREGKVTALAQVRRVSVEAG